MIESSNTSPKSRRRLPSIFDNITDGARVSLDDLETLMQADTERRILAVLDRVLDAPHAAMPPEPAEPS